MVSVGLVWSRFKFIVELESNSIFFYQEVHVRGATKFSTVSIRLFMPLVAELVRTFHRMGASCLVELNEQGEGSLVLGEDWLENEAKGTVLSASDLFFMFMKDDMVWHLEVLQHNQAIAITVSKPNKAIPEKLLQALSEMSIEKSEYETLSEFIDAFKTGGLWGRNEIEEWYAFTLINPLSLP